MQAVIMAAGKSTRTYPLTLNSPKPLLPVLNRPLIFYNLDQLAGLVDEVIFIVGYQKEMIENMLGTEYCGMKITFQEQKEQLGTGHAVLQAASHIKGRFLVMMGDDLYAKEDFKKLLSFPFGALAMEVDDPSQYGIMQINEKNHLINFIEKPETNISKLVSVGCYIFEPTIFSILERIKPSKRGEIELPSAVLEIAKHQVVQVIRLTGYWFPTGFPWDLLKAQHYLMDQRRKNKILGNVEKGAHLWGQVKVGKGSIIRSGAQIFGPVCIGNNCIIGPLSYIGPYTSIGDNVKVGANCTIEESLVMKDCEIKSRSIVSYSVISSNVILGEECHLISSFPNGVSIKSMIKSKIIDTKMANLGAIIADNVKLGARTLVNPGCKIWPKTITPINSKVEHDLVQK